MIVKTLVKQGAYFDSVALMLLAREVSSRQGVADASVVMATEANKALLAQAGLLDATGRAAGGQDLVVAVKAATEAEALAALTAAEGLLARKAAATSSAGPARPRSLRSAVRANPGANLAVVSVAGPYAGAQAWDALRGGLHVLLFSDHVPVEEEVALKRYARERGLLLMGPGAGTAVLNGVGLGFANVVPAGPVGIVAAAGTGLQEVSTLLAKAGVGVTQAIGTGGRDVGEAVGGIMLFEGLKALEADPATRVVVVVSKVPAPSVTAALVSHLATSTKPTVLALMGAPPLAGLRPGVHQSSTLREAAAVAAAWARGESAGAALERLRAEDAALRERAAQLAKGLAPAQRCLRGLFSGGTLCEETLRIWTERLGEVWSNGPIDPRFTLPDPRRSQGHTAVDLGEEDFTQGRPHPMIDNEVRLRRLAEEAKDPSVAAILLDVVIGHGSHPDPASEIAPAVSRARAAAEAEGRRLTFVASVTGTERDPQGLAAQTRALEAAGVVVLGSNAAAALLSAGLVGGTAEPKGGSPAGDAGVAKPAAPAPSHPLTAFFGKPLTVVNVGLRSFAEAVAAQGALSVDVDFRPQAPPVPRLARTPKGVDVDEANAEVVRRMLAGKAVLVGLGLARDVVPGMRDRLLLHAGPPVTWDRMCGPVRGAVIGACLYEGWAATPEEAVALAEKGEIAFDPCHHHHAVGPMAGLVSPSMPVWIVENATFGNRAFCTLNEGLGKVLRFGAYAPEVVGRLRWMASELYPALDRAVRSLGAGIDVRNLVAQALYMGDECHNRNKAGTSLFLRAIGPALARTCGDGEALARILAFVDSNDHFFLNLSMPAGKALAEPAEGVAGSTVVTTMARNGTDFGIRVAGLPGRWFTAPAGRVKGLYFPGFSEKDANPDMGDSTITETAGFGGMAMACAPAIVKFVGGTPQDAVDTTLEMYEVCAGEHEAFLVPVLDFRGTPVGIDVRRVVETGLSPRLNTGIAHKDPGVGQVGAGLLRAPMDCFVKALEALRA